jgi:hypothetical protein
LRVTVLPGEIKKSFKDFEGGKKRIRVEGGEGVFPSSRAELRKKKFEDTLTGAAFSCSVENCFFLFLQWFPSFLLTSSFFLRHKDPWDQEEVALWLDSHSEILVFNTELLSRG